MESESLVLQLQRQLHEQQQTRLYAIEKEQAESRRMSARHGEALARIEENTKNLPDLDERIARLERTDSRHRGALAIISFLWTALAGYVGLKR